MGTRTIRPRWWFRTFVEEKAADAMSQSLPDRPSAEAISDSDRVAAIARLHELVGTGDLAIEEFSTSLEQVLAADSQSALEGAVGSLPSIVRLTPASRRLSQPVRVDAAISRLELGAGWQLGAETFVKTNTAKVRLDLCEATWDSRDVDLHLQSVTGKIDVIVPRGVSVQLVSARQVGSDSHMSSRPRDHVDGGEGPPDCRTTGIGFYEREPSLFAATAACPSSDRVMSVSDRGDTKTAGVQGPEHRIDRYTAIERYTAGTARLCFEGHRRGTLEAGRCTAAGSPDSRIRSRCPPGRHPRHRARRRSRVGGRGRRDLRPIAG